MKNQNDHNESDPSANDSRHEIVEEFQREFAGAIVGVDTMVIAAEMLEWAMENGYYRTVAVRNTGHASSPVMTQDGALEILKYLKPVFTHIWKHPGRVKIFALFHLLVPIAPWIADLYGGMSPAEFARWLCDERNPEREYLRHTKQNVNKEIQMCLAELTRLGVKLPPRADMRKADSKKKMRDAKLKPKK